MSTTVHPGTTGTESLSVTNAVATADAKALVQNVGLRVIRDRVELTPAFVNSLNLQQIAPKSTLVFVAREIVVNAPGTFLSGVVFGDYHLLMIADTFDARHGIWVQNNTVAPTETVGAAGPDVTILCRELLGASVLSIGGQGGPGKKGKDGEDGGEECEFHPDIGVFCTPLPGKDGGNGTNGAKGGNGGKIALSFVHDRVDGGFKRDALQSIPGTGGDRGAKGLGGKGDPDGADGQAAQPGPAGDAQTPTVLTLSEEGYRLAVQDHLGADFATWRELRLHAADYYFRAFRPTPDKEHYLSIARDEAAAVLRLAPTPNEALRATRIHTNIVNNLNVLGLPRDYVLHTPPQFLRLNQRLKDYEEPVNNFFRNATDGLLLADLTQAGVLALLTKEKGRLLDPALITQLQAEIQAANADKTAAATQLNTVKGRVDKLKKEIKDLEFKISAEGLPSEMKLSNGITLLAGTVVVLAGTLMAPPAGAAAAAALMPLAADLLGNGGMSSDIKTIFTTAPKLTEALQIKIENTVAKGLNEFVEQYGISTGIDQAKAEKDWKDPALKIAFSFAKITKNLVDIANAKDPLEIELVKKYQELMAATHQHFLAQLGSSAAEFRHQGAVAGDQLRLNDLARVDQAIAAVTGVERDMRKAVIAGVRNARTIRDLLLGRVFEASRALDIYTLSYAPAGTPLVSPYVDLNNPASRVAYDYGYVHPDVEAEYLDGKITHTQFKNLLDASMQTIESMGYDDAYEAYKRRAGGMVGGVFTFPRNDNEHQAAITAFRDTQRFFAKIDIVDIWSLRHEVKVTGLTLKLEGVKMRAPFSCKVWHYGRSQQRVLPSDTRIPPIVEQHLPQSDDTLTMRVAAGAPTTPGALTTFEGQLIEPKETEDGRIELRSWGRGVAAEWMVELEAGTGNVDLSQLSGITLSIEYDSFEEDATPDQPSLRSVQHTAGTLLPGATTHAALALTAPAPPNGLAIRLTSSNPAVVKVPGSATIPAGATTTTFPIEITPTAAGGSATITATGDFTLRTIVNVPPQTKHVFDVSKDGKPGFVEPVNAIAADNTFIYATHFFAKNENRHDSFAEGELIRMKHVDFTEQLPRVKLGFQPRSMAINPNPAVNCIYVANAGKESRSLRILDRTTLKDVAGSPLPLEPGPMDVAVNTKTNRVYVTNWLGRKVHVLGLINPQTKEHAMVTEIKAASGAAALTGWHGITVDETHNLIYAARFFVSGTPHVHAVAVIDGTTNTIIRTITHPALVGPIDVALNAAGTRLYVAMLGSNSGTSPTPLGVAVFDVDPATGAATFNTKIQTRSNPTAIVANHQRNQVYVTIAAGVQIIDGETLRITSTVPTGRFAQSVAVSTASNHICVGDGVEGTLTRVPVPALDTLTPWT